ncbi:MAG: aspartate aminotransferase family protein [Armatimonadota bacterium]
MPNETQVKLFERAKEVIVGGAQAHKRPSYVPDLPIMAQRGEGCYFWDPDGNRYIDYLCAYGPILLGYAHPKTTQAALERARQGTVFNIGTPLEILLAEKLVEIIPCAEMVSYFISGSESTSAAVKIARAVTGREKVVRCGYHGWHDWCQTGNRGVPRAVSDLTLDFPYNDLDSLAERFRANPDQIACVIMEPVLMDAPAQGFLEGVKRVCHENGALLIFDEIKTGFRYALGGAQEHFGVTPDLATLGKAMANGWPIAVVVGRRQIMQQAEDVWVAATFNGESMGVAAALATIEEMQQHDGVRELWRRGERLRAGLDEIMRDAGVDAHTTGAGPMPFLRFGEGLDELKVKFFSECAKAGVYFPPDHVWFLCLAHTDGVIEETLIIARQALKSALASAGG